MFLSYAVSQSGCIMGGMATARRRALPSGWYPARADQVRSQCERWPKAVRRTAVAAVVPHAGWSFSGALAYLGVSALDPSVETVIVVGGHLPAAEPVVVATEDRFETPLGFLESDRRLVDRIASSLDTVPERSLDNSVEVLLPLIAVLLPRARVVWLRAPADETAITLGNVLAGESDTRSTAVLGSTDLTHYGPRFGFVRPGGIAENHRWVSEVSDQEFLNCCLSLDSPGLLDHAIRNRSACSPGAAAAAIEFARSAGCRRGEKLGYATSYDSPRDENFVGYGTIAFMCPEG